MHVFGFEKDGLGEVVTSFKPFSDFPSLSHEAIWLAFMLTGIGEIMAIPASKVFPPIDDSHASLATRTEKPLPPSSIVAWCPVKKYLIYNTFPFSSIFPALIAKN